MTEPTLNYVSCPDAAGGHRMAWWEWGDPSASHVVMCVHGLSRQGRDFDLLAQALVARAGGALRVVCPDVVGRGRSDWLKDPMGYQLPELRGRHAGPAGAVAAQCARHGTLDWVGTSMGGLIGMAVGGTPGLPLPAPCAVWFSTMWAPSSSGRRCSALAPIWAIPRGLTRSSRRRMPCGRSPPALGPIPRSSGWTCRGPWCVRCPMAR
jgi:hypothetical protein